MHKDVYINVSIQMQVVDEQLIPLLSLESQTVIQIATWNPFNEFTLSKLLKITSIQIMHCNDFFRDEC